MGLIVGTDVWRALILCVVAGRVGRINIYIVGISIEIEIP